VLGIATVLACLGLKAVFDSHSYADPPIPHLYSLHSWMGLAAVALAVAQWLLGEPDFIFVKYRKNLNNIFSMFFQKSQSFLK
jgi:cytochrome b-561